MNLEIDLLKQEHQCYIFIIIFQILHRMLPRTNWHYAYNECLKDGYKSDPEATEAVTVALNSFVWGLQAFLPESSTINLVLIYPIHVSTLKFIYIWLIKKQRSFPSKAFF